MALFSCGSKQQCQGTERCACYANSTCNAGLECRSNLCVSTSSGGSGNLPGPNGTGVDYKKCESCAQTACKAEYDACKATSGCAEVVECALSCGADAQCLSHCKAVPSADVGTKIVNYEQCALTDCLSDCSIVPGGSAGASFGGSSSGGASSVAGAGHGGSKPSGGNSSGGTGAGSGGTPATEPTTGINWLTLAQDAAPGDQAVNGALGIEGVFYAYGDACSTQTMSWDPETRCLSGTLCVADELGTNWGVSIGFDFNNVKDTKHAWNASAAGVSGIAWRIDGSRVPSLQLWVQNMDPSYNGTCSAESCSINGPPDGQNPISSSGQMSFASMVKDNWGGTGTAYVFNPGNISSLQLKIPAALSSIDASYDVCFEALGVVR